MKSGTGAPETAAFSQALAALKRRGSNLLLLGAACDGAHAAASRRLLGNGGSERRRLLVLTERASGVEDRLPAGERDQAHAKVVDATSLTRSAATVSTDAGPTPAPRVAVPPNDLVALGGAVHESIDEFDAVADGLEPAELRVCLDSLRPLLDEHDGRTVFRFLHVLTNDVRRVKGMSHVHLPVAPDDPTARTLAPLFDAVVELRTDARGDPQQRWTVRDGDLRTDWLPL